MKFSHKIFAPQKYHLTVESSINRKGSNYGREKKGTGKKNQLTVNQPQKAYDGIFQFLNRKRSTKDTRVNKARDHTPQKCVKEIIDSDLYPYAVNITVYTADTQKRSVQKVNQPYLFVDILSVRFAVCIIHRLDDYKSEFYIL